MSCLTLPAYSYAAAVTGTVQKMDSHTKAAAALSLAVTALALPIPCKSGRFSYTAADDDYLVPSSPTDSAYSSASSCPSSPTTEAITRTPPPPSPSPSVAEVRGRAIALARLRIASSRTPSPPPPAPVRKSVRFADEADEVAYTHAPEDYDRSVVPMATLNFRDFAELLQIRAGIRRQAEEVLCDAAMGRFAKGNMAALRARGFYC